MKRIERKDPTRYEWRDFNPFGKGLKRYLDRNIENLNEEITEKIEKINRPICDARSQKTIQNIPESHFPMKIIKIAIRTKTSFEFFVS